MNGAEAAAERRREAAERRREAAGWLAIAREDLRVADACLALDPPARGMAAYHCQQAAEKAAKGLLTAMGVTFRKTHDLDELADLAKPVDTAIEPSLDAIRPLTVWGSAYRYPTMEDVPEPAPSNEDLRQAMTIIADLLDRLQMSEASDGRGAMPPQRRN